jgi:hypothetical protein
MKNARLIAILTLCSAVVLLSSGVGTESVHSSPDSSTIDTVLIPNCGPPYDPGRIPEFVSDVPIIIDWMGATNNCGHPQQLGCRFEIMHYKNNCLQEANPLSPVVSRWDRSANELVAWAVREGMRGDKWTAVAWLALGECHDFPARKAINDNKREAFEYVMAHYVAVWRHVDPDHDGGNGQALREGQEGCGDSIEDCVGDDVISTIQIPTGLAVTACKDEDCDGHTGHDCHTFVGPGTWSGNGAIGPHGGGIGFLHDEISYFRVFRP